MEMWAEVEYYEETEALDMAIEALQQSCEKVAEGCEKVAEGCDDYIRRQPEKECEKCIFKAFKQF